MATHSSILAWKIPRTEEPGRLQSMELQRVRHDRVTNTLFYHLQVLILCTSLYPSDFDILSMKQNRGIVL